MASTVQEKWLFQVVLTVNTNRDCWYYILTVKKELTASVLGLDMPVLVRLRDSKIQTKVWIPDHPFNTNPCIHETNPRVHNSFIQIPHS